MRPARVAFLAMTVVVTGIASYLAFSPSRAGSPAFWALAAGPTVALAVVAAAWAARDELLREWLSPSPREIWLVSLYGQIGDPRALQAHAPAVAAVVIVVALAEEVLWRGMVTQLLADRVGSHTAWAWAAGLYALAYVPTMWALRAGQGLNPVLAIAALGGGLVWGAMARGFRRLAPGVLAHALFDWAVIMMFPLWGMK